MMKSKMMKTLHPLLCLLALMLLPAAALAQHEPAGQLRVSTPHSEVKGDSLRLTFTFTPAAGRVASTRKLICTPLLRAGIHELPLAPIVISGRRRWLADRRATHVDPSKQPPTPPYITLPASILTDTTRRRSWQYRASVPYASWMNHAQLCMDERSKECCVAELLGFRILNTDINLDINLDGDREKKRADTVLVAPPVLVSPPVVAVTAAAEKTDTLKPAEVELCVECTVVYINFRQGKYDILPGFENNHSELAKVDSVIANLPRDKDFRLYISGYASPEGLLADNEVLARNRTEGFVNYLRRHYTLPRGCSIRSSAVGEDWEGLTKLLQKTGKPYAPSTLQIIRDYGIFDGRERKLMDMQQGNPYRDMLETLFPYLRRIEMRVRIDSGDE